MSQHQNSAPAKALQGYRTRPTVAKPVVPAIPLPYIQKRKNQSTPLKKTEAEPTAIATAKTETQGSSTGSPSTSSYNTAAAANGTADGHTSEKLPTAVQEPTKSTTTTNKPEGIASGLVDKLENQAEGSTEGEFRDMCYSWLSAFWTCKLAKYLLHRLTT